MSKSLGNVVDPRTVIEGGKNPGVSHLSLVILYHHISFLLNDELCFYFLLTGSTFLWS